MPASKLAGHGRLCSCSSSLPASLTQTAQRQEAEFTVLSGRLDSASTTVALTTFSPVSDQKREDLVPNAGSRGLPEDGGSGPECRLQKPTRRGRSGPDCRLYRPTRRGIIWSRMKAPEAHQKRDDLVQNEGTRSPPEEGRSGPEYRHQKPTRRGKIWSRMQAPEAHEKKEEISSLVSR